MKPPRAIGNLGLIFVSIAFGLLIVEHGVRWLLPNFNPGNHIRYVGGNASRPTLGPANTELRMIRNNGAYDIAIRFNAHGLRDSKDLTRTKAGDYFVVGDPQCMGYGVGEAERFSDLLQALASITAFNLCIPGSFGQYEKLLDYALAQGAAVERIIVTVSMETDLFRYELPDDKELQKNSEIPPATEARAVAHEQSLDLLQTLKTKLIQNSAAYFWLTSLVHRNDVLREAAESWGLIRPELLHIPQNEFDTDLLERSVSRLNMLTRRFASIVLLVPSRSLWTGERQKEEVEVHLAFRRMICRTNMRVIDVKANLEAGGNPLSYFFAGDGHLNSKGHTLVAERLADAINSSRFDCSG